MAEDKGGTFYIMASATFILCHIQLTRIAKTEYLIHRQNILSHYPYGKIL
jgi:hypothetical protein